MKSRTNVCFLFKSGRIKDYYSLLTVQPSHPSPQQTALQWKNSVVGVNVQKNKTKQKTPPRQQKPLRPPPSRNQNDNLWFSFLILRWAAYKNKTLCHKVKWRRRTRQLKSQDKGQRSTRFCAPFKPPEVSFLELRKNREDSQTSLIIVEPNRTW